MAAGCRTMRSMRNDFPAMKQELHASLTLSRTSRIDDYYNVISSISEMLHCAIESIEDKRPFDCTYLLPFTFDSLDRIDTRLKSSELMFFKFARTFALFMDTLNGCDTSALQRNGPDDDIPRTPITACVAPETVQRRRGRPFKGHEPGKRARLCPPQPDRFALPPPAASASINLQQQQAAARPSAPILRRLEEQDEKTVFQRDDEEEDEECLVEAKTEIKEEMEETMKVWNEIEDRLNEMQGSIHDQPGCSRDEIKKEEEEYCEHVVPPPQRPFNDGITRPIVKDPTRERVVPRYSIKTPATAFPPTATRSISLQRRSFYMDSTLVCRPIVRKVGAPKCPVVAVNAQRRAAPP
ncbi:hypothetical protein PFISCL1PPCAC_7581 [Pristionchus fissidentatus]|uniref:Uncharacterized protein n=1 Tax=Pristionchus fissidentatus TaxID=1538716 RepID=A0AAV5VEH2_9BILA|nr:hypothetical protein PFISCL1PPCAC_7581 [Pristionchus fissidentatus]